MVALGVVLELVEKIDYMRLTGNAATLGCMEGKFVVCFFRENKYNA